MTTHDTPAEEVEDEVSVEVMPQAGLPVVSPRAINNPISIGEYTNVPAPGSLVASAWSQQATNRTIHRFNTIADINARWPAATAGPGAYAHAYDSGLLYTPMGGVWTRVVPVPQVIPPPYVPPNTPWTNYAPVWTTDGQACALGNGQITGSYRFLDGKTVALRLTWVSGPTTTYGSGSYHFSLPVVATLQAYGAGKWAGTKNYPLVCEIAGGTSSLTCLSTSKDAYVGNGAIPEAPASGYAIWCSILFEAQ